jgi:hypothetical protein
MLDNAMDDLQPGIREKFAPNLAAAFWRHKGDRTVHRTGGRPTVF